ncbi:hat family dimerization domaincontaining protein-related [Holotrichia oblita]|uniref:Hat family dimerization domaincontaining protein-related n=1 Tax=Holotrichia oblita TaxID=644536 RepID=A0ACB9T3T1_HOLOL|nr:hat family dimerization domaincontaining protein-related [Holotrichia oblita]
MQYSFKRQTQYKEFQQFLDIKPHKLLQPSQTRWLSLISVVKRVLEQYEALKLYFQNESFNQIDASESIHNNLQNPMNKYYLEFLEYVLPVFTDLNKEFQSESPKIYAIYDRMLAVYKTILSCYINNTYLSKTDVTTLQYRNPEHYVLLNEVYCGPKAAILFQENTLSDGDKHNFQLTCLGFYVEAAHQLYKRFPFNAEDVKTLKLFKFLNPKLIKTTSSLGPAANFYRKDIDLLSLEREWRLLQNSDFNEDAADYISFWKNICNQIRCDNTAVYPELSKFVNLVLTLPHSSASVERIFSAVSLNKSKIRNRLSATTLTGILHSKRLINSDNKSCFDYKIPVTVTNKHNNNMYSSE